jgi:gamma-glutamylaminecyclotransferase
MHKVFVFGTLKRGFPNHAEGMAGETYLGRCRTARSYPLVIAGRWFSPVMMPEPGNGHQVIGELYEVDDRSLARLDEIESVHLPTGYRRESIDVVSLEDGSTLQAWAYFKDRQRIEIIHSDYLPEYDANRYVHKSQRPGV